jgi:hypothetical protein
MNTRFKSVEGRKLMVLTLAMDPNVRQCLRQLLRMGAYNIRPDHMYVLNRETGKYDYLPDPGAWNADLDAFGGKNNMGVTMLRSREGEWFLNGC